MNRLKATNLVRTVLLADPNLLLSGLQPGRISTAQPWLEQQFKSVDTTQPGPGDGQQLVRVVNCERKVLCCHRRSQHIASRSLPGGKRGIFGQKVGMGSRVRPLLEIRDVAVGL